MSIAMLILTAALSGTTLYGMARWESGKQVEQKYDKVMREFEQAGVTNNTMRDIVGEMYETHMLSPDEFETAIQLMDSYDKYYADTSNNSTAWNRFWQHGAHKMFTTNPQSQALLDKIYSNLPLYLNQDQTTAINNTIQGFYKGLPNIADVPAPKYLETDPNKIVADLYPVEPVKLWSNKELADYHGMNYNPNDYYDMVKQRTSAALENAEYKSAQMNEAAMIGDSLEEAAYLDSIRNNRAQAITSGATEGARAAADLLAMNEKNNSYAQAQGQLAQDRFNAVDQFIKDDAYARITARQEYENLARNLWNISATLYENDTDRFGQDWLTNAEMYTADIGLLGNNMELNGQMSGDYAAAQAAVNSAKSSTTQQADRLAWVFNRFLDRNNGDFYGARKDMTNYLFSTYTGKSTGYDYLTDVYFNKNAK